jgi:hypothetical protein
MFEPLQLLAHFCTVSDKGKKIAATPPGFNVSIYFASPQWQKVVSV